MRTSTNCGKNSPPKPVHFIASSKSRSPLSTGPQDCHIRRSTPPHRHLCVDSSLLCTASFPSSIRLTNSRSNVPTAGVEPPSFTTTFNPLHPSPPSASVLPAVGFQRSTDRFLRSTMTTTSFLSSSGVCDHRADHRAHPHRR